jgi:ABC-2 type transport system permease protein
MLSKTSYFSGTVFKKNLTRFWPIWVAYFVIGLLALPVGSVPGEEVLKSMAEANGMDMASYVMLNAVRATIAIMLPVIFIVSVLSAMAVFSHLYSTRSAGMSASLPVRREGMYLSSALAGFAWLEVSNLVICILLAVAQGMAGCFNMQGILICFGILALSTLAFYGFACFCAVLTGHMLAMPAIYIIGNFMVAGVGYLLQNLCNTLIYGFRTFNIGVFNLLSPLITLINQVPYTDSQTGKMVFEALPYYAVYGAVGLILAVVGLLIYKKRRMESATDVIAVKALKPVFKYGLTFGCGLALGQLLYVVIIRDAYGASAAIAMAVCVAVAGIIGYYAGEMLLRKTFKVFDRWWGAIVSVLILGALILCIETDVFGYEKYVPAPNDISSVTVVSNVDNAMLTQPENIEKVMSFHESIIASKSENEKKVYGYENGSTSYGADENFLSISIYYEFNNGKTVDRSYVLPVNGDSLNHADSCAAKLNDVFNCDEAIKSRFNIGETMDETNISYSNVSYTYIDENGEVITEVVELTAEQASELYNDCIIPDVEKGALGKLWVVKDDEYYNEVYACEIYIESGKRMEDGEYVYTNISIEPTVDSKLTNSFIEKLGVKLLRTGEIIESDINSAEAASDLY